MTSSPDGSGRETLLLRGAPAAGAVPYQRAPQGAPVWGRPSAVRPAAQDAAAPAPAAPVPPPRAPRMPSVVPPVAAHPTAAHSDQAATARVGLRLGEVYAEQLARLREEARREGWAAGHAEGLVAAEQVVRAAEQAAEERLADVQARWERRLASATAAMGAAVERLDETAAPAVDELRDSILDAVVILVGDLFGRELAMAAEPGLDALRRALTLCPDDVPVVVRLHPDDLAEVPAEALAQLPASVTVRGDADVERAGALAEAGTQRVDAQLSAALDRVREVLRS
ncbi:MULTISPECIES: FliH/SctL family protein [unclassified Modestobacter]|uniref:FliH/SctL family protein n=1 Tax=unclassified Modestobacter TaxID=2643866 RepID=UPI0022AA9CC3|nr:MULTISPECIES: FliH/SctL family protein [unclassified Modestobacter]MCZ2825108.1 FliH/SctL family protein [Modestobacter sp. VKM Ac-2981]MCZ2853827.1 FliH/SctL family protein [Modestobacter sp. VKM Ac-2982]